MNYFENGHFEFGKSKYHYLKCSPILICVGMWRYQGNEQKFKASRFKWLKRPSGRLWRVVWQLFKIM